MCPSRLVVALNQKCFSFSFISVLFFSLGDCPVEPPSTRSRPISRFLHLPHSLIWTTLSHSQHPILVTVSFGARELTRGYWKSGVSVLCDVTIILSGLYHSTPENHQGMLQKVLFKYQKSCTLLSPVIVNATSLVATGDVPQYKILGGRGGLISCNSTSLQFHKMHEDDIVVSRN